MRKVWLTLSVLTNVVREAHEKEAARLKVAMFYCHDFDHAVRVANYAMYVAEPEYGERTAVLAGAAGLCHNADRILQRRLGLGRDGEVPPNQIRKLVLRWLSTKWNHLGGGLFEEEEKYIIVEAVLGHSAKNGPNDHPVQIALMDADRIVNTEADCIIRNGIYFGDDLPVVDPINFLSDPSASWRDPKSNLRALAERDDWLVEGGPVGVRLKLARELMKPRLAFYHQFFKKIAEQRREAGLLDCDYPR